MKGEKREVKTESSSEVERETDGARPQHLEAEVERRE